MMGPELLLYVLALLYCRVADMQESPGFKYLLGVAQYTIHSHPGYHAF